MAMAAGDGAEANPILKLLGSASGKTDEELKKLLEDYAGSTGDRRLLWLLETHRDDPNRALDEYVRLLASEGVGIEEIARFPDAGRGQFRDDSSCDYAMASASSPLAMDYLPLAMDYLGPARRPDPMRRVQAIVDDMNRLLKEHRFSDARAAIQRLPSSVPESARKDIRRQIDEAEESFRLQAQVTETLERAQDLVNQGDFASARAAIDSLPSSPEQLQRVKIDVMGNIQRIEQASRRAEEQIPRLLDRLQRVGVQRHQIDEIAAHNQFDTSNPLQFQSLLEQLISQVEGAEGS